MSDQFIIFADDIWRVAVIRDGEVRVGVSPIAEDTSPETRAGVLREQLASLGYVDQPVLLALGSSWCLCAAISTEGLDRGLRGHEVAFRLEEHLPISSEDFVVDCLGAGKGLAMGVCCELARLEPLVKALEASGVRVRHVSPIALLAAEYAVGQHAQLSGVLIGLQVAQGEVSTTHYDLVEIREGKPAHWWWLAGDDAAAQARLADFATSQDDSMPLAILGCNERLIASESTGIKHVDLKTTSAYQAAACQAAKMLDEGSSPWIDLRRDKLAAPNEQGANSRAMTALATAIVLLLISVSAVMQWRGRQYENMAQQSVQEQSMVFKATLPNQPVTSNVKGRLLSERRKLSETGSPAGDASDEAMRRISALVLLRDVLANLPREIRYRILDLSIQSDMVKVEGQAKSHIEAERLAAGLRQSGVFQVEPPKTQALKDAGVSFLFTAKPQASAAGSKVGGT